MVAPFRLPHPLATLAPRAAARLEVTAGAVWTGERSRPKRGAAL